MPTLLFVSPQDPPELWLPALRAEMPDLEVRVHPETGDPGDIDYALSWEAPNGLLASLPNLRAIFSIAAGVDHLLRDPDLPRHLPIVRMVDPYLRQMMAEYAVLAVLHFHRYMPHYRAAQAEGRWDRGWPLYTPECPVGILGIGAIGQDVAAKLGALGFPVRGWSRRARAIDGIACYHGADGLRAMLADCPYLVCVLPLTKGTEGIIDAGLLAALPRGAHVINIGRGAHVVDDDLLAALDSGQIAGAFLDVFNTEPLPPDHPYWRHPKVVLTPHVAGELVPRSCARYVVENIRRHRAGEALANTLDLGSGY